MEHFCDFWYLFQIKTWDQHYMLRLFKNNLLVTNPPFPPFVCGYTIELLMSSLDEISSKITQTICFILSHNVNLTQMKSLPKVGTGL